MAHRKTAAGDEIRRRQLLVPELDRLLLTLGRSLEVRSAHTIADGLAACAAGPVDVVVRLDQQLPDGEDS